MRSRAEQKAATREKLLRAAAEVIAEKGYRAASLDEIAERAGLTKGAVYSNFDSKEDLFFAVVEKFSVSPDLSMFADPATSFPDQLRAFALSVARLAASPDVRFQLPLELEFALLAGRDERARATAKTHHRFGRRSVAAFFELRAAESDIQLPMPAEEFATALIALLRGLMQQQLIEPEAVSPELFADAVSLLFGASRPAGRAESEPTEEEHHS